jgi:glutaminyl-tRNA synthetase
VSAPHSKTAEVRLYDHLFTKENPDEVPEGTEWLSNINPKSLETLNASRVEPSLADAKSGDLYQFERLGYFCVDSVDSKQDALVFNRAVTLRDTWARIEKTQKKGQ